MSEIPHTHHAAVRCSQLKEREQRGGEHFLASVEDGGYGLGGLGDSRALLWLRRRRRRRRRCCCCWFEREKGREEERERAAFFL